MDWLKQQVIAALSGDQKVSKKLLIYLAALVATISLILVLVNQPKAVEGEFSIDVEKLEESSVSKTIFVHIVGEVENPGMFQLSAGARLVDAVFAAGGMTKRADHSSVNLARELFDGEQIVVYAQGEENQTSAKSKSSLISINRAGDKELETLPGIGPALAGRIIAWREANGGFKTKQDLLKVSGIGETLLAGILDLVTL
jgi:competence protein ComEA